MHTKLITAAAKTVLRPMGLFQKGRSRTWLDDRQWWMCVVVFQPSSWSRGSYLNVGCMWLWHVKDYISFDEGYRVDSFVEFRDEHQFESAAAQLADRAAKEVARYRALFPNISSVCEYLLQIELAPGWPWYDAGIACALVDKRHEARELLKKFTQLKDTNEFVAAAQEEAERLISLVGTAQFRELIAEKVRKTREIQKLPELDIVSFE
jgi:hypothetical protein